MIWVCLKIRCIYYIMYIYIYPLKYGHFMMIMRIKPWIFRYPLAGNTLELTGIPWPSNHNQSCKPFRRSQVLPFFFFLCGVVSIFLVPNSTPWSILNFGSHTSLFFWFQICVSIRCGTMFIPWFLGQVVFHKRKGDGINKVRWWVLNHYVIS